VRGSIAKPGAGTLRYGGNTCCAEVRADDGTVVVLDCGTGIQNLGRTLRAAGQGGRRGHLLIGHTHWDHIQGFPFFDALFVPGGEWHVYAPGNGTSNLRDVLSGQMSYEYYPIPLEALDAAVRFEELTEGALDLGGIRVTTQYMNHPALTLAYRLEAGGATVVYATDHEPHSIHPLDGAPGAMPVHHEDQRHVRFLEGADLLIHDAQYSLEEFSNRVGWGHTPVERAVDYAIAARVKRLALFHHDPDRDDDALDRLVEVGRARAASAAHAPEVFAAAEGQTVEVTERPARERAAIAPDASALLSRLPEPGPATVLIVDDEPDMVSLWRDTLAPEGIRLLSAHDGAAGLALAREVHPALIVLDLNIPELDGFGVCRSLRADPDPRLRDVPILIVTGTMLREKDLVEAFVAGATDYLTKPIKPTLLRSRVRGWLLRTRPA
jgi:CheY-like chemotaxis protein/phosphoribosyl 1,2-cyclic phosphodiesterase